MVFAESYSHVQKQEQRVTASMIQGLNMLSLPAQAMYDYLVELSMANPMLDIPEPRALEAYGGTPGTGENFTAIEAGRDPAYYDNYSRSWADADEDFDPYYSKGVDLESEALAGSLKLQLSMCRLSPVEEAIGLEIIGDLDESGYFTGSLETICLLYCQSLEVGRRVLSVIQGFQPRGIAAANVYEALCLQVDASFPYGDLAKRIINEDLQALCDSSPAQCAARYNVSESCMCQVFDYIRSLEPRPGNCDERPLQINYIVPDIVVERRDGELHIYVSGEGDNPLTINDYYLHLLDQPELNAEEKHYLRQSLNSAKALIHSVDIRRQTLSRAAHALVALQRDFFLHGPENLRPLTMQQLADEMGVNVSTVSRIVQDKYISTSWGMFPLKRFFLRALNGCASAEFSVEAAKRRIEELISSEDSASPLTDDEICAYLEKEGFRISRRTVSKYRQAAGIPSCIKRKRKET